MRRVLVIHNPVAGRRRRARLDAVAERLRRLGCAVTVKETARRGDAEDFARTASAADHDVVAAAGGDGTANEVVNGLAADGPALAIIPLGTANVLASEIGLDPTDALAVARAIAFGPIRPIHVGDVNGRRFLMMAGAGLDAEVVAGLDPAFKRRFGRFAYVADSVRRAAAYAFPTLTVTADGREHACRMVVACKGRHYGGPFVVAPRARLGAPAFEVCLLPRGGFWAAMRYGLALPLGLLPRLAEVSAVSAASLTISGPPGAPVQGDGDIIARLPATLRVADPVRLVVPEERCA
jgi:YegS/Rv2252/BmrU family lipid kinase